LLTKPITLLINGRLKSSPAEVSNALNTHFVSVSDGIAASTQIYFPNSYPSYRNIDQMDLMSTTEEEIQSIISNMNGSAANGYDNISVKFLKKLNVSLSPILTRLMNQDFSNGRFPEELKIARVKPIFKGGDPLVLSNYRPISILNSISKVYESVIRRRLECHFNSNRVINKNQFGFRRKSSTLSACSQLIYNIQMHRDGRKFVSCVFVDIKKAFDCVSHELLLHKLSFAGITGANLNVLRTYLQNRKQFIEIDQLSCRMQEIKAGIPQGSLIGPILFNFFINDLFDSGLKGELQMYADDTVLLYAHENLTTLFENMNFDMRQLDGWLSQNQLAVNAAKTEYILFNSSRTTNNDARDLHFQNRILKKVETYNYLGLIIDSNLNFTAHVDHLKRTLIPFVFAIRRLRHCLTMKAMWNIYYAFFMSRILYLNPVWSCTPGYKIDEICRTQNKFIKAIKRLSFLTPTASLYDINTPSIQTINKFQAIFFIFKLKNHIAFGNFDLIEVNRVHGYPTRQANDFYIETASTNRGRDNVLNKGLVLFNQLPQDLKQETSVSCFKARLLRHFFPVADSY
jgi:hypothetical protein